MKNRLTLKDFNIFSKTNELNRVETEKGTLTLFKLFFPLMTEYLLRNLMNTISLYIMGRVSDDAVAAIGVANQILEMCILFYTVVSVGTTVVINQNLGAGRKQRAEDTAVSAIYVVACIAIALGIVIAIFATPLIRLMNLEESLVPMGASYLRIVMGFSLFQAVMTVSMAESRAYGNTVFPVIASLSMNVINAILSYIVVFRPFETPLFGVSGIAVARITSEACACILMLTLLRRVNPQTNYRNLKVIRWPVVRDIFKIGLPSGVQYLSYSMAQAVTTAILAGMGAPTVAAKIYVYNIVYYSYLIGMSLGQANELLVGRLVGQGKYDRVRRMTIRNLFITITINILFSSTLAALRYPLLSFFTDSAVIIGLGATAMIVDIFVEIGRGMNHTFEGALIASGDVRFTMCTTLCTTWGLSVLFSYILGVRLGWGLVGAWIAFMLDEVVRGLVYILRWRSGAWTTKSLVRDTSA